MTNRTNISLKFSTSNAKLGDKIATMSLPAGHSCPFAKECHSKANKITGKIIDGKHCQFRCYSASQEALYPALRKARWHNFNLLRRARTEKSMGKLIQDSLPLMVDKVRVHVSGDFFSERYFLAWLNVALNNPSILFYGYTKALPFMVKYRKYFPGNFRFVASKGGTHDHLIKEHGLRYAEVVFSIEEAEAKGLDVDHDDSHAISMDSRPFALLLHATQPAGTPAAEAWTKIKKSGIGGYGKKTSVRRDWANKPHVVYLSIQGGKVNKFKSMIEGKYIPFNDLLPRLIIFLT